MMFPDALIESIRIAEQPSVLADRFVPVDGRVADVLAVDGGSGVLLSTPSHAVCIVRTFLSHWRGTSRLREVSDQFLVHIEFAEKVLITEYRDSPRRYTVEFEVGRIPQDYVDVVRKRAEPLAAAGYLRHASFTGVVLLDGDLEAEHDLERDALDELQIVASSKLSTVAALSKTNRFVSEQNTALVSDLIAAGPPLPWIYPVSDRTAFVKLHPKSKYVFRLDAADPIASASALLSLSADPVFLGYPYPLVDCDARARVSFREVDLMRLELGAKVGEVKGSRGLNAHAILDALNH